MPRTCAIILCLLLLAGMALRLGWSMSRGTDIRSLAVLPDQVEYLQAGTNVLTDQGMWFFDDRFGQQIWAGRMPGYPLFVAACKADVRVIRVAQALIDLSTALAIFLIARRWLNERRALLACGLVVFNPLLVYFSGLVLSETLYVAMLAWSLYLVLRQRTVIVGLLLCAAAIHVRPSGIAMPVALAVLAPWIWQHVRPVRAALLLMIIAVGITLVVLAPWAMRNRAILGRTIWLTTNGGITLYDGVRPGATGASDQRFVKAMPELQSMNELQRDDLFQRLNWQAIHADPLRIMNLAAVKTARTWSPVPLSEQFGSNRLYVLVGLGYGVPLFALALWGLIRSELPWRVRLLLIAPAILITLMHALSVGSLRYRLPADPLLAVIAVSARSIGGSRVTASGRLSRA